jgi:hypothetical protein
VADGWHCEGAGDVSLQVMEPFIFVLTCHFFLLISYVFSCFEILHCHLQFGYRTFKYKHWALYKQTHTTTCIFLNPGLCRYIDAARGHNRENTTLYLLRRPFHDYVYKRIDIFLLIADVNGHADPGSLHDGVDCSRSVVPLQLQAICQTVCEWCIHRDDGATKAKVVRDYGVRGQILHRQDAVGDALQGAEELFVCVAA